MRLAQDSLRTMSDETGGFAVVNRNDFATAFQRIVDDNSSYYMLGYYSSNERRDGRFRKIEVRLKNRPGLVVRARKGYVAPRGRAPETKAAAKEGASPELKEALESPLPLPALPLAVTAAVFKGPAAKGSVVISTFIHGGSLPMAEENGMFKNDLEIVGIATDDKGKSFTTDRNTVNLNMKPDTANRVKATGFRVIQSLDLAPGRYLLRVGVKEANTRKAGMVTYDLEVPEFTKTPLTMSDIALTSAMSGAAPTIRPKDPLEKLLPGPLTTYREFPSIDEVALFTEVYDNIKQAHKTEIVATVKAEGGQTVCETPRGARQLRARRIRGWLWLPGARAVEQAGAGTLRAARRSDRARRRSRHGVEGDRVPRRAGAGAATMIVALAGRDHGHGAANRRGRDDRQRQPQQRRRVPHAVARRPAEWAIALAVARRPGKPAPTSRFHQRGPWSPCSSAAVRRPAMRSRSSAPRQEGKTLIVEWRETRPKPGMLLAQVLTSPALIASIPKFDGEIAFKKVDR